MKRLYRSLSLVLAGIMIFMSFAGPGSVRAAKNGKFKVTSIKITNAPKKLKIQKGKKYRLKTKVKVKPNKKKYVKHAKKSLAFRSSNRKIVTVNAKGQIKAKKVGTARITVSSKRNPKKKVSISVNVVTDARMNEKNDTEDSGKNPTGSGNPDRTEMPPGVTDAPHGENPFVSDAPAFSPSSEPQTGEDPSASDGPTASPPTEPPAGESPSVSGAPTFFPSFGSQTDEPSDSNEPAGSPSSEPPAGESPSASDAPVRTPSPEPLRLRLAKENMPEWATSGEFGSVSFPGDGTASFDSIPPEGNSMAWYIDGPGETTDLSEYQYIKLTIKAGDDVDAVYDIGLPTWSGEADAESFWDRQDNWGDTVEAVIYNSDGTCSIYYPTDTVFADCTMARTIGVTVKSPDKNGDEDENLPAGPVIVYGIELTGSEGEQTNSEKDQVTLKKLIVRQRMDGAAVSKDIYDPEEYEWDNGRLVKIFWYKKKLTGCLDVSKLTRLEYLNCQSNQVSELNLGRNLYLEWLGCSDNLLSELDVSENFWLERLYCSNNSLSELDVRENPYLVYLSCQNNQLSELDVSENEKLVELSCQSNQLSELDVSKNEKLISLYCDNNQLIELDTSDNQQLEYLYCFDNQLIKLDVSNSKELIYLDCSNNQLSELDVSGNEKLKHLYCSDNPFIELDVSNCPLLENLSCDPDVNVIREKENEETEEYIEKKWEN